MNLQEKIIELERKQDLYVGDWEEYDKIGEIITVLKEIDAL